VKKFLYKAKRLSYLVCVMKTQNTPTGAGTSAAQPIELTYNQVVRGEGFTYAQRITVGTVRGYEAEHGSKYNVQVDPEKAHQRAVERGHEVAWTNQECAVLTADYPGKAEQLASERAEIAASVILQDGQQVIIEGQTYTARLVGARYSNPIKFDLVA
jgi:hypothetical protein